MDGSQTDITEIELEGIYDHVDAEIAEQGVPSDDQLRGEIEAMNKQAGQ